MAYAAALVAIARTLAKEPNETVPFEPGELSLHGAAFQCTLFATSCGCVTAFIEEFGLTSIVLGAIAIWVAIGLGATPNWIAESAVPLTTVDPAGPFARLRSKSTGPDPEPLGCILGLALWIGTGILLIGSWLVCDLLMPLLARVLYAIPIRLAKLARDQTHRWGAIFVWQIATLGYTLLFRHLILRIIALTA